MAWIVGCDCITSADAGVGWNLNTQVTKMVFLITTALSLENSMLSGGKWKNIDFSLREVLCPKIRPDDIAFVL